MATTWTKALAGSYRGSIDELAAVLRDCPDELWEASIIEPRKTDQWMWPPTDPEGRPFDDPEIRERKFRAMTAVWRMASHALFFTDVDLSATAVGWAPPAPFSPQDEDGYVVPPTYSRDQLLGYVEHCRTKAEWEFTALTDDRAAQLVDEHRNGVKTRAEVLVGGLRHLTGHASELRTFLSIQGVRPGG
ncbi:hypothetical protein [Microlunatus parietis]|uniref:DinB superfamily protein n=1 Tax=Microlunatus parietis TaxID=682979 RepID=A0A7Y9I9H9_9ACTN|nr:hypothetical protein [Microlunatus parietis]NYE72441.1 hypothetical protein [Microlunatus parietis]